MTNSKPFTFKFKFVQNGQASGFRSKAGAVAKHAIKLGDELVAYQHILETTTRDNHVLIRLDEEGQFSTNLQKYLRKNVLVIEISQAETRLVERHIDRSVSQFQAEERRKSLAATGRRDLFRSKRCPHCESMIDLTGIAQSDYIYCRFCESIIQQDGTIVSNGDIYRLCDECDMFDRVRGYTIFNFYFWLIVYSFSIKRRHLCDACAITESNRALLRNFLFLLGIPAALWMRLKATSGRRPGLKRLANANALARKGKHQNADKIYARLSERFVGHPGILSNAAMGHFYGDDASEGHELLEVAVNNCSNYLPALQRLQRLRRAAYSSSNRY